MNSKAVLILVIAFVICSLVNFSEGANRVKRGGHGGGGGHGKN